MCSFSSSSSSGKCSSLQEQEPKKSHKGPIPNQFLRDRTVHKITLHPPHLPKVAFAPIRGAPSAPGAGPFLPWILQLLFRTSRAGSHQPQQGIRVSEGHMCRHKASFAHQQRSCCLGTSALVVNHISFVFHLEEQGERRISQERVTKRPT